MIKPDKPPYLNNFLLLLQKLGKRERSEIITVGENCLVSVEREE